MSLSDSLADTLTRIRNGQNAKLAYVNCYASKLAASVMEVLKNEGYIRNYQVDDIKVGIKQIKVELKYHEGVAVIKKIERVSRPGRRVYSSITKLSQYYNGLGMFILSTPKGIMTDHEARLMKVGGEILCKVF